MGEEGESIHEAARNGHVERALAIIASNPLSVTTRDRHSRTPYPPDRLHLASWAGQAEMVRILCENKANVGASAADEMAAIHFASQKGHIEAVRYLLAAGASVNACTRKGMTPLHFAVQGGHLEVSKALIRKGANLEALNRARKRPLDLVRDEEFRDSLLAVNRERKAEKQEERLDAKKKPVESHTSIEKEKDLEKKFEKEEDLEKRNEREEDLEKRIEKEEDLEKRIAKEEDLEKRRETDLNSLPPNKKMKVSLTHLATDEDEKIYD